MFDVPSQGMRVCRPPPESSPPLHGAGRLPPSLPGNASPRTLVGGDSCRCAPCRVRGHREAGADAGEGLPPPPRMDASISTTLSRQRPPPLRSPAGPARSASRRALVTAAFGRAAADRSGGEPAGRDSGRSCVNLRQFWPFSNIIARSSWRVGWGCASGLPPGASQSAHPPRARRGHGRQTITGRPGRPQVVLCQARNCRCPCSRATRARAGRRNR